MRYIIRLAKPNDLGEIIQLCSKHAAFEKIDYNANGKEDKLAQLLFCEHPNLSCFIVESSNSIIGYASFSKECSTWHATYFLHLDCLFIEENYRGLGIGKALLNSIIEYARKNKLNHLEWQTPSFNEAAIKFYNSIGAHAKQKLRYTLHLKQTNNEEISN